MEKIEVKVTKLWLGEEEENHEPIEVFLLKNGDRTDHVATISEEAGLTHTFRDLHKFDEYGKEIFYNVEEVQVEGFKSEIKGNMEKGFIIENRRLEKEEKPEKKTIVEAKLFDSESKDPIPGAIFNVIDQDGGIVREGLKTDNNGKIRIDDLREGSYKLEEVEASPGYIKGDNLSNEFKVDGSKSEMIFLEFLNDKRKEEDKASDLEEKASDLGERAEDKKEDLEEKVEDKVEEKKENLENKASDLEERAEEKKEDLEEKVDEKKEDLEEKVEDKKEDLEDKASDLEERAEDKKEDLEEKVEDKKEDLENRVSDLEERAEEKKENLEEKVEEKKENLEGKASDLKEKAKEKKEDLEDLIAKGKEKLSNGEIFHKKE